MNKYITAGIAIRREIRRFLLRENIDFIEDKGWIDSVFYLKCSDDVYKQIIKIIDRAYDLSDSR